MNITLAIDLSYEIWNNSNFRLQNMPMLMDHQTEPYSNTSADLKATASLKSGWQTRHQEIVIPQLS